jgi:small-conductance mechanosensitive channel
MEILHKTYFETPLIDWLIAAALTCAVSVFLVTIRRIVLERARRWAGRTETRLDDVLVGLLASLRTLFFVAIGLWVGAEYVRFEPGFQQTLRTGVTLLTLFQIGLSLQAGVRVGAERWAGAGSEGEAKMAAAATSFLASLSIWALVIISGLSALGFQISALLAGLGIGGVAAALAVQSILGDLFASLSIYFDRPFNIGDFIITGTEMGTVERIGLRTTRVRSLGGEEIVFANGDLTKSRIRNYKKMTERRVLFGFGVEYGTTLENLREIPSMLKSIVEARTGTRFDRAHFKEFGDFSLNFEVVYYVLSPDYNVYMDHQQAINLELFRQFAERGTQFAFPTRRILLASDDTQAPPSSGAAKAAATWMEP